MLCTATAQTPNFTPPHDFMIDNAPLDAEGLRAAFDGRTHNGIYRFDRTDIPTRYFSETTQSDGRVLHFQGVEKLTGRWTVQGDQICYNYDSTWTYDLCFQIYRVGSCYYHYLKTSDGRPVNAWTARTTPEGDRPDCETPYV